MYHFEVTNESKMVLFRFTCYTTEHENYKKMFNFKLQHYYPKHFPHLTPDWIPLPDFDNWTFSSLTLQNTSFSDDAPANVPQGSDSDFWAETKMIPNPELELGMRANLVSDTWQCL